MNRLLSWQLNWRTLQCLELLGTLEQLLWRDWWRGRRTLLLLLPSPGTTIIAISYIPLTLLSFLSPSNPPPFLYLYDNIRFFTDRYFPLYLPFLFYFFSVSCIFIFHLIYELIICSNDPKSSKFNPLREQGVKVEQANYNDNASLVAAFKGKDAIILALSGIKYTSIRSDKLKIRE